MNIKLKSLHLENFKGIKLLNVVFGDKTKVKGQNASGKTTVFDAFTWLLFNKNSAGEEKFNVRPLDANGNRIDNVEIKVVAVLEVDGKDVELSKVQKQRWVKKRGTNVTELQGNENIFEIDGYPKSESDYKTYVSGLVAEDLFKMLTNPQFFPDMKWKEQRDILMKLVSEISDVELARGNSEFAELLPELEKAPSTDDIQKKFSKALSEWKKKQAEIPVRIDELSKSLVQIDTAEHELMKADLERRIAEIDSKVADSGKIVGDLMDEEMKLQMDMSGIMQTMNRELSAKKNDIESSLFGCRTELDHFKATIPLKEQQVADNKAAIETAEKKRSELGNEYKELSALAFNEAPYQFCEEEWKFDKNSTICKSCGQTLPKDKIEQIKADFEARKAKAKADAEKRLEDAKNLFYVQKQSGLEGIKNSGFKQKHVIEELTSKNETLQAEIETLKKQEQETLAKQNDLEKQLAKIPAEANYSQNDEYVKLKAKLDAVKAEIAKASSVGHDELMAQFEDEKKELSEQLDAVKAEIAKVSMNVEIEERIGELETEQQEVAQKVADQEKMLYLLEQFIKAKMLRISESINSKFNTVSWKLFEEQLNGGMRECCECTVNGVPYSTLNSGHRIVAGLDIIQSLSELYGVTAPIFVDNAESLNEYNVPDMAAQMILLAVSDDKELKVEVQ